ncbi:MAG: hypothetical protein K6A63_00015, partial [Acholeplasmatales bacterium]|nr:hypothetical protein [Acholeplasmatales bacterium]
GSSSSSYQYDVTFHHNYYYKCGSRLPFTRNSNFHIYNCYYYASTGTNMQIYNTAYAFIENCYFDNTNKTFTTSNNGVIKLYNNIVNSTSYVGASSTVVYASTRDEEVTNTCTNKSTTSGDSAAGTSYVNFDTDSTLFYYDSENNKSDVTRMDDAADVKTVVPQLAGAGLMTLSEYEEAGAVKLTLGSSVGTYTENSTEYSAYRVVGMLTNVDDSYVSAATIQLSIETETKAGVTSSKQYDVTTLYKSLTKNGSTICAEADGTYYFYFNIYGLTEAYDGYSFTVTANVNINDELLSKTLDTYTISLGEAETTYIAFEEVTSDVTKSTEYSNYTINATSEKKVSVSSLSSSLQFDLNGETITSGIALGGVGAQTYRNVEFTVSDNATIKVYYNGGETRYLALYDSSYTKLEQATGTTGTSVVQNYTYSTVSAGTYYIASAGSGIQVYAIVIEYN